MPEKWMSKQFEQDVENDDWIVKKTELMLKYQKHKQKNEEDSDEDLKNWENN